VAELLRQAAEEAAELTASAEDEAEDLLERARVAADAVLARARQEADRVTAEAAAERARLAALAAAERQAEAVEAARRVARDQEQAQAELADLCARLMSARASTEEVERRHEAAVAHLREVLDQVGTALRSLDADLEPAPVPPPLLRSVPAAS
jgi:cell division septum initiation protein DivIVA